MKKHIMVIESRQVHSTYAYQDTSMFICIHISKKYMRKYLPDIDLYQIRCIPEKLILMTFRFTKNITPKTALASSPAAFERLRTIITYVEENFRGSLSLQEAADKLGFTKEYFCRFFRKNMGMSFLEYVNEVRLSHIYYDLIHSDTPVSVLTAENGFTNQKLFNRTFKELYGCTPSSVRKR